MKKILVLLLAVCFSNPVVYAQSGYQVLKGAPKFLQKHGAIIARRMRAPVDSEQLAERVARLTLPTVFTKYRQSTLFKRQGKALFLQPEIFIQTEFKIPVFTHPSLLWGSYQYLRVLTKVAQTPGAVKSKYVKEWKTLRQVTSYNGVHHIVNQRTLRNIYTQMKHRAKESGVPFTVRLHELLNGAPASLHPYHGNPKYKNVFHNLERQEYLYQKGGVQAIVTDYFKQLNKFHRANPKEAPKIPTEVIANTLLEAKLWAETFHLKWK